MSRNMSQTQIDRRKKVGAELTRGTSALGLGSLAALGASKGRTKLAGGRLLPKVNPANAEAFHEKVKDKLFVTGLVSSGIGGANGFNNASWQSAESRQRKKPIVKSASSPFEDGYHGEISKGVGDWKTIDQRERSQTRARKTMRTAGAATATGAGLAAIGVRNGGLPGAKAVVGISRLHAKSDAKLGEKALRIGRTVKNNVKANPKTGTDAGLILGGGALAAGGAATAAGAKGGHTYQQHKINQRRRANFKKSLGSVSAFGVAHD